MSVVCLLCCLLFLVRANQMEIQRAIEEIETIIIIKTKKKRKRKKNDYNYFYRKHFKRKYSQSTFCFVLLAKLKCLLRMFIIIVKKTISIEIIHSLVYKSGKYRR